MKASYSESNICTQEWAMVPVAGEPYHWSAMVQAVAAAQALEFVGMPEAGLSITQAIIFICESPKSNSVVIAKDTAFAEAKSIPDQPVPIHLRDTSYPGASKLGHGRGYKYPHD